MVAPLHAAFTSTETRYLQQLESMREEMSRSMQAISGNSLQVLEESLWRQEVLCVSLQRLVRAMSNENPGSGALLRVHTASADLHRLTQTYARLIQQARTSCDLMYSLCRSYNQTSLKEPSTSMGHPYPLEA